MIRAEDERLDVVVIGGGLAGLTVAYRLKTGRRDLRIGVFEASDRIGGKVQTRIVEHEAGRFVVEQGPDSFLTQKPWARDLAIELGLEDALVPIASLPRSVGILKRGVVIDWPAGMSLLAPTEIGPFLRSPLISRRGKARMALDFVRPPRRGREDESLSSFVRRRLGQEAVDWIAEPLMAGIYSADPDELSIEASFPQLRQMEREKGSVVRGMRAAAKQRSSGEAGPPSPFLALRNGMQSLVDRLDDALGETVRLETPVERVAGAPSDWSVFFATGDRVQARSVVFAVPGQVIAPMVRAIVPEASDILAEMRTSSSGVVSLAFPDEAIEGGHPGYGLVAPRLEERPFNAITVASRKFPHRAPEGWTLFRLFFGGARSPEMMRASDAEVVSLAVDELRVLYEIVGEPDVLDLTRWRDGNPIAVVGHMERLGAIEAALPEGLFITGGGFRGSGMPDVVRDASAISERVLAGFGRGPADIETTYEHHDVEREEEDMTEQLPAKATYTTFWIFRSTGASRAWSEEQRQEAAQEAERLLEEHAGAVSLRAAYSTVGLTAGVDLILWLVADDPASFQALGAALTRSEFGTAFEAKHAYLGMGSGSQYDPNHGPAFLRGIPPKRYLSVYPFTKTPAWYLLPFDARREMMKVHGQLGDEFPTILTNTVSSFGVADQEFVVALEDDDVGTLIRMVQRLRGAEVREYTQVDTPIFLGLRNDLAGAVLDGMP
jgi:protoporphyrinogen/coproporphyrinogen III oxidase